MNLNSLPSRKAYIDQQRSSHGHHLFGVFPAQYPKEILWAFNILPVEIWDPPLEISQANAHLQTYICSVVKLGLELILQGKAENLDGFLFPHTCDSIQNLASIVYDYLGLDKPCYFFYHPKAPYKESSRRFYMEQLRALIAKLEKQFGPLDLAQLNHRVEQGQRISALMAQLYGLRAEGKLTCSNKDFYRIIRLGEYLHPDDFIPLLDEFLKESKGEGTKNPAVIMSGVLPNPPEILELLDELGVRVAGDDFLNCSRRLLVPPSKKKDPIESLTEGYFAMPPCSTKDSPLSDRTDYLLDMAKRSGAKGVIFYMVKFCEPELFDVPLLVEELKKEGLATLIMDVELNRGFSGQLATRVEAFIEMIG